MCSSIAKALQSDLRNLNPLQYIACNGCSTGLYDYVQKCSPIQAVATIGDVPLTVATPGIIEYTIEGGRNWYCPECISRMKKKNFENIVEAFL